MPGLERDLLALALDDDGPLGLLLVVAGALARRRRPVIELHDLGVGLEPVAHLVLGRVDRPVIGERQVRQMVVPDRIVQTERLVALAPGVARTLVGIDDQGRHADPLEPRAETDAALPAADDQHERLALEADLFGVRLTAVAPGHAVLERTVRGAVLARGARLLLEALQLGHRREQRTRLAVLQPQVALATAHRRFESEPAIVPVRLERIGPHVGKTGLQHLSNRRAAFERDDIPGEGDQIAPIALFREQGRRGLDVVLLQRRGERTQPVSYFHRLSIEASGNAAHSRRTLAERTDPRGTRP